MDKYNTYARFYPMIIFGAPILIVIGGYLYGMGILFNPFSLFGFIGVGVTGYLIRHLGRDCGKKKEKELFDFFGGKPTTLILRHQNTIIDAGTKKRYHQKLRDLLPGYHKPLSKSDEVKNQEVADQFYESSITFLKSATRDKSKYHLIFRENVDYGFRRNLWGLKMVSIITVIILLIINSVFGGIVLINKIDFNLVILGGIEFILVVFLFFWFFVVTKKWVRIPAFGYAERLVEAIDTL